jgi:hypothetical protein
MFGGALCNSGDQKKHTLRVLNNFENLCVLRVCFTEFIEMLHVSLTTSLHFTRMSHFLIKSLLFIFVKTYL